MYQTVRVQYNASMSVTHTKTIVVTGAAGFLGSHLCDALLARGIQVIGVDNFITGRSENMTQASQNSNFTFIQHDVVADPMSYLPSGRKIDGILHFASPASPPRYQAHPVETYQVNSQATHLLLSFLRQHNPSATFLFASTSEVYGDPLEHPQAESYWGNVNPNGARSCYDESKRMGETICGVFNRDFGFDTRLVRIFNTYGPRMDPTDGRVLPNLINQALSGQPLTVYGDGSQTRSYCYYSDLIAGILALFDHPEGAGQTVNLGNQQEMTILDTARQVSTALFGEKSEAKLTFLPLPQDDPTRRRPDISKAQALLGWTPKVEFAAGLTETITYFRSLR